VVGNASSGLIDIGGRRIWLECRGAGGPVVILEAGYPHRADIWDQAALGSVSEKVAVLPGVAAFTRVCAYDRPGTILTDPSDPAHHSRSDPVPQPRTAANLVTDLRDLLRAADIPGPYVLVGHSLGGIVGRLYAATFPAEVAGLVLVDSSHEGQSERFQAVMTPEQWAVLDGMAMHPPGLDVYPGMERIDLDASFAQLREAAADHPLDAIPLVVVTHGRGYSAAEVPAGISAEAMEAVWQDLQAELATLTPTARQIVATESGHYVPLEQPDLVIEAIQTVVGEVRRRAATAAG
jgi:pimeloyl-ACP methyl ester carboxylesterase